MGSHIVEAGLAAKNSFASNSWSPHLNVRSAGITGSTVIFVLGTFVMGSCLAIIGFLALYPLQENDDGQKKRNSRSQSDAVSGMKHVFVGVLRGIGSPGAGVVNGYELPEGGIGNRAQDLLEEQKNYLAPAPAQACLALLVVVRSLLPKYQRAAKMQMPRRKRYDNCGEASRYNMHIITSETASIKTFPIFSYV
ncbi:hypothetical protein STEG23_034263 [Scotinomys teguina]